MTTKYIGGKLHRVSKRKLSPIELLCKELRSIGIARLNAIGSGKLGLLLEEVERGEQQRILEALGKDYREGYTW